MDNKNYEKLLCFLSKDNVLDFINMVDNGEDVSLYDLVIIICDLITSMIDFLPDENRQDYNKIIEKRDNSKNIDMLYKLFLEEFKEEEIITEDRYVDFFNKKIKSLFLDTFTYEKLIPSNVSLYFGIRIDKSIPWSEMAKHPENEGICIISLIESGYLDYTAHMEDFTYLIGEG